MRDAFGGTFMIKVMITFFVIYICFFTIAINFAKTFMIKNEVINMLENKKLANDLDEYKTKIDNFVPSVGYSHFDDRDKLLGYCDNADLTKQGICVKMISVDSSDGVEKYYYKVTSYLIMNFPLFDTGLVIPISGETKVINL